MSKRIDLIQKVFCKDHENVPLSTCAFMNNLKLQCADCEQSVPSIQLSNLKKDILSYYEIAKDQRQRALLQVDNSINTINSFLKAFQDNIDKNLKSIKDSLNNMKQLNDIEQYWINGTAATISFEELTSLIQIWNSIYTHDHDQGKSQLKDAFKNEIERLRQRMVDFSTNIMNFGNQNGHGNVSDINQSILIMPQATNKQIDRLLYLEQDPMTFPQYSVCHFKVLKQCKLKKFLMPPIPENITMVFSLHNNIETAAQQKEEFNFVQSTDPAFYEIHQQVLLQQGQYYTLSLQLKDKQRKIFKLQQYQINAEKNQYIEFIEENKINLDWGTSNQTYFTKGLFSSLIIE